MKLFKLIKYPSNCVSGCFFEKMYSSTKVRQANCGIWYKNNIFPMNAAKLKEFTQT